MSEFDFSGLGPDLILDAIESTGLYPESGLLPLNSYENRVYQFVAEDRQRYVVKFYRPERWSNAQINEEHDFSVALQNADIAAVAPLSLNGQMLHEYQGYRFAVFPSVGGRMFELDDLDHLERLGQLIGRVHKVAEAQPFEHRETVDIAAEMRAAQQFLAAGDWLPSYLEDTFFSDLDLLINECQQYLDVDYQAIRLHGDCHTGNILWRNTSEGDDAVLVDFDDCLTGPAMQDLWMMLSGDNAQRRIQLETLVEGYELFRPFNHTEFALIEPLRTRRMLNYIVWIAKRWSDPAFPRNFSWFNTDKYWEEQVLAIKEQISALREPVIRIGY